MEHKVLLWVDSELNITNDPSFLKFSPIDFKEIGEIIWVKNYDDFVAQIENYGVPDAVSFDDKLEDFNNKNGLDCAKFLCSYCAIHETPLPLWSCHFKNNKIKENINSLMNSYLKYQNA